MLTQWVKPLQPQEEELKARLQRARDRLEGLQLQVKAAGLPVLILVEGWGASGKGSAVGRLIQHMDPRFFTVKSMSTPSQEEKRYPFLQRYMAAIPQTGQFAVLDSGWMDELVRQRLHNDLSRAEYERKMHSVCRFERQLTDNGYLVLKLFLHISCKEQKKRLEKLQESVDTSWRVSSNDLWQNEHYEECYEVFDSYMKATNLPCAPWYIIDAKQKKWAELQILEILESAINTAMQNKEKAVPLLQNTFPLQPMPLLSQVDLSVALDQEQYKEKCKKLQQRLSELHNKVYRKKIPVVIVYEGWDAAGKGGNIKRVAAALDARGYQVHPIASPRPDEKARHYLWRFWTRLPKTGHFAIFDRSWYGRVMVERLEGFCSENDWQRAYNEINEFEDELIQWGAVVIKFWVHIDKQTQLERFTDRQNTPDKQWKITDEDWRNREKWDEYEVAVNEMLQKTSTQQAPWYILASNSKYYARVQALEIIIEQLEKALKEKD